MYIINKLNQTSGIAELIRGGGIIAYPTEAVYGLGCDPFNKDAVKRLLAIKERAIDKGLILIAANWQQVADLVIEPPAEQLQAIQGTWPGPVTWVFPSKAHVPDHLTGDKQSIAVRVTDHPIACQLCQLVGKALVSTSANKEGEAPLRDSEQVQHVFADQIDALIVGDVGGLQRPTTIRDALTGTVLRG